MARALLIFGALLTLLSKGLADDSPARGVHLDDDLTLVVEDGGNITGVVGQAMRSEVEALFAGFRIDWVGIGQASKMVFRNAVIVVFNPDRPDYCESKEDLALGQTQVVNGSVIPFVTIYPERVKMIADSQLRRSGDRRQEYLGRSIGRVLAHELYHALSRSQTHSKSGIMKAFLTGPELAWGPLGFEADQVKMLRLCLAESGACRASSSASNAAATAVRGVAGKER